MALLTVETVIHILLITGSMALRLKRNPSKSIEASMESEDDDVFLMNYPSPDVAQQLDLEYLLQSQDSLHGIQLHLSDVHKKKIMVEQKAPKYTFGVSTGHCGTTTLSNSMAYANGNKSEVLFDFEHLPRKNNWKEWFALNPSFEEQVTKVSEEYKTMCDQRLLKKGKTLYMDMGHHNLGGGILQATPAAFGEDTFFIRVRRNRLHTALSYALTLASHGSICNDWFALCPLKFPHVLQPQMGWGEDFQHWKDLSTEQQVFWYIDEVEAQFQSLLKHNKNLSYLECNWDDDLGPCFHVMKQLFGMDQRATKQHQQKRHISKSAMTPEVRQRLIQEDADYQKKMDFDSRNKAMIEKAQFTSI